MIFSSSLSLAEGEEGESESKKREREEKEKRLSLSRLLCLSMKGSYVLFYLLLCSIVLCLLLIERVFVSQASVKYEPDQSTLDFVSEQIRHMHCDREQL